MYTYCFTLSHGVNAETIAAAGKWEIDHFQSESVSGPVIYERESVMRRVRRRWGHIPLLSKGTKSDQPEMDLSRAFSFSRAFVNL